ncbi:hypothetical protein D3C76_1813870 [compost metagenome]
MTRPLAGHAHRATQPGLVGSLLANLDPVLDHQGHDFIEAGPGRARGGFNGLRLRHGEALQQNAY